MNEANYTTTVGMNCEQVLHGPWAALEASDVGTNPDTMRSHEPAHGRARAGLSL